MLTCVYFWLACLHSFCGVNKLLKTQHLIWQVCIIWEVPISVVYWVMLHHSMSKAKAYENNLCYAGLIMDHVCPLSFLVIDGLLHAQVVTRRGTIVSLAVVLLYGVRNGFYCLTTGRYVYSFMKWKDPVVTAGTILVLLFFFSLVALCLEQVTKKRLRMAASVRQQDQQVFLAIYGCSANPADELHGEPFEAATINKSEIA